MDRSGCGRSNFFVVNFFSFIFIACIIDQCRFLFIIHICFPFLVIFFKSISIFSLVDGVDYILDASTTVDFAVGATEACAQIVIVDNSIALEGDKTFIVDFVPPSGTQPGSPSSVTVTIIDDDGM